MISCYTFYIKTYKRFKILSQNSINKVYLFLFYIDNADACYFHTYLIEITVKISLTVDLKYYLIKVDYCLLDSVSLNIVL